MNELLKNEKKRYCILLVSSIGFLLLVFLMSIALGQFGISLLDLCKALGNIWFGKEYNVPSNIINVIELIRIPRTIAAFMVGSSLAIAGCSFQSIFNNPLVSPDVLGVSAGSCVGAAVAIILGMNSYFIGLTAFVSGLLSVSLALFLPKLFHNSKTIMLVLSGIIVGSFMNSIIGLIKFVADKEDKLAEITFWIMGKLRGVGYEDIMMILPIYVVAMIGMFLLRWKLNVLSLGENEAKTLGLRYTRYRFLVIVCATLLTAASVSISGNVGWVGLVMPHIGRALAGSDNRYAIPISGILGGTFMMLIDLLARNISVSEVPLSILTGILGTIIYAVVLVNRRNTLYD